MHTRPGRRGGWAPALDLERVVDLAESVRGALPHTLPGRTRARAPEVALGHGDLGLVGEGNVAGGAGGLLGLLGALLAHEQVQRAEAQRDKAHAAHRGADDDRHP
eukprot:3934501-Rhodomonas_salina.2